METVVFAVGRFNPPTKGHKALIDKAIEVARKNNASVVIFTTRSHDSKKNPLTAEQKIHYLKRFFPGVTFRDTLNAYEAAWILGDEGYEKAIMIAGQDRAQGFKHMVTKGMKHEDEEKRIDLEDFDVVMLERDPDSDEISGLSATKARDAVKAGDFEKFKKIVPEGSDQLVKNMFKDVKEGLNL